ncbi:DUF1476 domain-containing protein [Alphaproteobacteria bacterium]|nr:DUF1476 domain-containing protein [Alphaproteobacteria bacterium]|tara:strand:+ start:242 stop:571 length:330 start_codon:yes stop_codon:yes gene_type:complete
MSSPLDKVKKAQEAKYARDADVEFKINARRNKLVGLWAANLIGLNDNDAVIFAKDVVLSDFEEPGQEDVIRKVISDLQKANVSIPEEEIRLKMTELYEVAKEQIYSEIS